MANSINFEWYTPTTKDTLFGIRALKHRVTKELCLFGKYGEVWEGGTDHAKIAIYGQNPQIKAKISKFLEIDLSATKKGDERILDVKGPLISPLLEIVQIQPMPGFQLRRAKKRILGKNTV